MKNFQYFVLTSELRWHFQNESYDTKSIFYSFRVFITSNIALFSGSHQEGGILYHSNYICTSLIELNRIVQSNRMELTNSYGLVLSTMQGEERAATPSPSSKYPKFTRPRSTVSRVIRSLGSFFQSSHFPWFTSFILLYFSDTSVILGFMISEASNFYAILEGRFLKKMVADP